MRTRSILAAIAALAIVATPVFAAGPFAQVDTGSSSIDFRPMASDVGMKLTVSGPDGFIFEETFAAGDGASFGVFDSAGGLLPDGVYTWRLDAAAELSDAQRGQMADLRASGSDAGALQKSGKLSGFGPMSGSFAISQGSIVAGGETEAGQGPTGENRLAEKTQVIAMDLVVQGSQCVGVDCPSSPSFGFDTLRLQENNLRIHFQDTSNSGSFPTSDWRIVANDSANGGESYLSFEDSDAGTSPFKVRNGAGNNALYVHTNGNVGLGTNTPAVELVVADGDSPTLRLEQNGSSGFTPQTWDVAGNEANFFVRDVTNGSRLGFKYRPGAAENTLVIDNDSQVAVGLANASAKFHVKNGTSEMQYAPNTAGGQLELFADGGGAASTMLRFTNANGPSRFEFRDSTGGVDWDFRTTSGDTFVITQPTSPTSDMQILSNGDLVIRGMLTQNSSRAIKHGFEFVDTRAVLDQVVSMPVTTWIYDGDHTGNRHIGPMAEDFYSAFGVGPGEKHIAVADQAGVALAAIQGLSQVVDERDQQIEELRAEIEALRQMVHELAEN